MTSDQNNALTIPEMVAIARAATPIDLDSAERVTVGEIVCPLCNEGTLDHQAWVNIDDRPVGIEVFGVGETLTAYEAFVRTFNPATIISLLEQKAEDHQALLDADEAFRAMEARAIAAEGALKAEQNEHAETTAIHDEMRRQLTAAQAERDLLQEILDGRPAINAGLPDSYIRWSQAVMSGDAVRAALSPTTTSEA